MDEILALFDENRRPAGRGIVRGKESTPEGFWRMAVHLCLFNSRGEMLIQHRTKNKKFCPGRWDLSVGGNVPLGEEGRAAMARETREEIGLELSFEGQRPTLVVSGGDVWEEFYAVTMDVDPASLVLQPSEVDEVRFVSREELHRLIDAGETIPYARPLIDLLFFMHTHDFFYGD